MDGHVWLIAFLIGVILYMLATGFIKRVDHPKYRERLGTPC